MLRMVALGFTLGGLAVAAESLVSGRQASDAWFVAACLAASNGILWWLDWKDVP